MLGVMLTLTTLDALNTYPAFEHNLSTVNAYSNQLVNHVMSHAVQILLTSFGVSIVAGAAVGWYRSMAGADGGPVAADSQAGSTPSTTISDRRDTLFGARTLRLAAMAGMCLASARYAVVAVIRQPGPVWPPHAHLGTAVPENALLSALVQDVVQGTGRLLQLTAAVAYVTSGWTQRRVLCIGTSPP